MSNSKCGTQSADKNVNVEVSSTASADANTNTNIKKIALFADADTRSISTLHYVQNGTKKKNTSVFSVFITHCTKLQHFK